MRTLLASLAVLALVTSAWAAEPAAPANAPAAKDPAIPAKEARSSGALREAAPRAARPPRARDSDGWKRLIQNDRFSKNGVGNPAPWDKFDSASGRPRDPTDSGTASPRGYSLVVKP